MQIQMFGGMRAPGTEGVATPFRTRRSVILLSYLTLFATRWHTRDALSELLWPEIPAEISRTRLRNELSLLRRQFGETVICTEGERLKINDGVTSDVCEFEEALQKARRAVGIFERRSLNHAAELYVGPLLPEFDNDWVVIERERLHELYLETLCRLTALCLATGSQTEATAWGRRAVREFPDRHEAVAALEQARTSPLRADERPRPVPLAIDGENGCLGRDAELNALRDWADASVGPRIAFLCGIAGVGKTLLTREFVRRYGPERTHEGARILLYLSLEADAMGARVEDALAAKLCAALSSSVSDRKAALERPWTFLTSQFRACPALLALDGLDGQTEADFAFLLRLVNAVPSLKCLILSRRPPSDGGGSPYIRWTLTPPPDAAGAKGEELRRRHLLWCIESVQTGSGEADEANIAFALEGASGEEEELGLLRLSLFRLCAPQWLRSGRTGDGLERAKRLLGEDGERNADERCYVPWCDALLAAAQMAYRTGDNVASAMFARRSLRLSGSRRDQGRIAEAALLLAGQFSGKAERWRNQMEKAIRLCRKAGNRLALAGALDALGRHCGQLGYDSERGARLLQESYNIYQSLGDADAAHDLLAEMAFLDQMRGRYNSAARCYGELLKYSRLRGNSSDIGGALWHSANVALTLGRYEEAETLLEECASFWADGSHASAPALLANSLSLLCEAQGDLDAAHFHALRYARLPGDVRGRANAALRQASVHLRRGDLVTAKALCGLSQDMAKEEQNRFQELSRALILCRIALCEGNPQEICERVAAALRLTRSQNWLRMTVEALELAAEMGGRQRRWRLVARLVGVADAARRESGIAVRPVDRAAWQALRDAASVGLGVAQFASEAARGATMTPEQAALFAQRAAERPPP